jgi:hypothetical protein
MESFGKFCYAFLLVIVLALVGGFVFQTLWGWFVVPTFLLAGLTLAQAMGISFFISYLKYDFNKVNEKSDFDIRDVTEKFFKQLFLGTFVLAIGYVIHFFI